MAKPDSLSRDVVKGKSGLEPHVFNTGQLLDFENDDVGEQEDVTDVELEGINAAISQTKNLLGVVLHECRLEVQQ